MLLADGRQAHVVFTDRTHGDLRVDAPDGGLDSRRAVIAPPPWTALRQVHGARVVAVHHPGEHAGAEADAAVTSSTGSVLAVQTADCAPIALVAEGGAVGVVHAGWRGLLAGVIAAAVAELEQMATGPIRAVLGPCIHPECYEFGEADLAVVAERFGDGVRATTHAGTPALDVPAAVRVALAEHGIVVESAPSACTACDDGWFSHRARGEVERQALVAWIEAGA